PDQRLEVVARLADVDPPSALRLLEAHRNQAHGIVRVEPAPVLPNQAAAAEEPATTTRAVIPTMAAAMPSPSVLQLLQDAKGLVLHAARRLRTPALYQSLRCVAADLDAILNGLRRGAPARTAHMLGERAAESVPRLIQKAKARALQAVHQPLNTTVRDRVRR